MWCVSVLSVRVSLGSKGKNVSIIMAVSHVTGVLSKYFEVYWVAGWSLHDRHGRGSPFGNEFGFVSSPFETTLAQTARKIGWLLPALRQGARKSLVLTL